MKRPCCASFVRVSPVCAAKLKHDAHANDILVERPEKPIVLAHEIKLNACSLVYRPADAAVVPGPAPRLDGSVVKLFPHHKRRIFVDRVFQDDSISISLCERRSGGCPLPSELRSHSVREQKPMKRWSAECGLSVHPVLRTYAAEFRVCMEVEISRAKRDPPGWGINYSCTP